MQVWVLRQSFLAYERFYGVFGSKEEAKSAGPVDGEWASIKRTLPAYDWDQVDPFDSPLGSESCMTEGYLWVVEPHDVH